MKIWIFNQYAITPDQAGGTRHYDLSRKLIERGHQVKIFAGSIHYANLTETKNYGDRKFLSEIIHGVEFVWIKTPPYSKSNWRRVLNMLSFARNVLRVAISMKNEMPDIIIGSSVHLFAVQSAFRVAKKFDIPFLMEVRDLWPQVLIDLGHSKFHPFVIWLRAIEKSMYKNAKRIITLLPASIDYLVSKGGDRKKIIWIPNGIDLARFENEPDQLPNNENFTIIYTGGMSNANGIDAVLLAADILRKKNIDVEFKLIGDGTEKENLIRMKEEMNLNNISFPDAVAKDEVMKLLRTADALLFMFEDSPVFRYGISPNKLFDYMAASRPIIFSCNTPWNPVEESKSGFSVPARTPEKLAEAIEQLMKMSLVDRIQMGERAKDYVRKNHSMDLLADKLEMVLVDVKNSFSPPACKAKHKITK